MKTSRTARRVPRARRALQAAVGLVITSLVASACAAGGTAHSAGSGQPRDGGELTFLIDSLGDTWIPNNSAISSFQGHIWGHVTDKLVYVDEKGTPSPWIAQSWDQNADSTQFTLHLRPGVTFSDGTPLDAAAVVANLDCGRAGTPRAASSRSTCSRRPIGARRPSTPPPCGCRSPLRRWASSRRSVTTK
jgi:peptide/nickel transport system substrate-binding protein